MILWIDQYIWKFQIIFYYIYYAIPLGKAFIVILYLNKLESLSLKNALSQVSLTI